MQGPIYKIEGEVSNKKERIIKIGGSWNSHVKAVWLKDTKDFAKDTQYTLWSMEEEDWKDKAYRLTDYALSFNYVTPEMKKYLLPTDSRRRLDIRYLLKGEDKRATAWKQVGENKQREDEKMMKAKVAETEDFWSPVWFKLEKDHKDPSQTYWNFTDSFWKERAEKEEEVAGGKEIELYYAPTIKESAADFTCYRALFANTIDKYLGEIRQKERDSEKTKEEIEKEMEALKKQMEENPEADSESLPSGASSPTSPTYPTSPTSKSKSDKKKGKK